MDELYLCPDCRTEHADPHEAVLGHRARCAGCTLLLEMLVEERASYGEIVYVRLAA